MQAFQVFRSAQVTRAGIELAYQFGKEKQRRLAKIHNRGVSEKSMIEVTGGQGRKSASWGSYVLIWLFAPFQKEHA
jgi:hypothetical protein